MKNNKGFTLVELLAVIVILLSISLITMMGISASLERRDEKECEEQIELAINAAKIYFSLNDTNSVTINVLKDNDYFDEDSKINRLGDNDKVTIGSTKYIFSKVSGECSQQ